MKNAVSNIWLLGLVVLFIFVFSGYLAITVSYSAAFKMKNEVLTIIEKHKGLNSKAPTVRSGKYYDSGALETINAYVHGMGYKVKGSCPVSKRGGELWYGVKELEYTKAASYEPVINNNTKYFYCFSQLDVPYSGGRILNTKYYKVLFFFKMDLPVLGDLFTFEVPGTTDEIINDQVVLGR